MAAVTPERAALFWQRDMDTTTITDFGDFNIGADGSLMFEDMREILTRQIIGALAVPAEVLTPPRSTLRATETISIIRQQYDQELERLITSVYSGRKEANDRSIALLKEWLSPAQREQYEQHGYFDVIGGDTGGRYRIYQPAPYNISALADDCTVLDMICVVPQNVDAGGDVMLAQKIWLEKDEAVTLSIANKHSGL